MFVCYNGVAMVKLISTALVLVAMSIYHLFILFLYIFIFIFILYITPILCWLSKWLQSNLVVPPNLDLRG